MNPVFRGTVTKGVAVPDNPIRFAAHVRSLEGKPVELIVRKFRKSRSNPQNRYYWGVVIALLVEAFGWDDDEESDKDAAEQMHDALRMMFLKVHFEELTTIRSTASLSTVEFEDYMLKCRKFGAERGCQIPEPNEVEYA